MAKAKMNKRTWFKFAIIGSLVVGLSTTALLTLIIRESKQTIMVPITTAPVARGELLTPAKITTVPIGKYNLPNNMVTRLNDLNGMYATREFAPNEYLFATSLTDNYMKSLQEKAKYGAIAISADLIQSVNADIKENDFVRVLIVTKDDGSAAAPSGAGVGMPDNNTAIIYTPELSAVRVLGIYDGSSGSIEPRKDANRDNEKSIEASIHNVSPKMIVFDALPIQQTLLAQAEYSGRIHLVVHPKDVQDAYRRAWGLIDDEGINVQQRDEGPISIEEQERRVRELEEVHMGIDVAEPLPTRTSEEEPANND